MLTEYNNDPDLWENEVACKNCTPAALSSKEASMRGRSYAPSSASPRHRVCNQRESSVLQFQFQIYFKYPYERLDWRPKSRRQVSKPWALFVQRGRLCVAARFRVFRDSCCTSWFA